jgi:hypothetical protein
MKLSALTNAALDKIYNTASTVMLTSKPGQGKTERIRQYCTERNMGCVVVELTSMESCDLRGFLIPSKNEDGQATSKFTRPPILEMVLNSGFDKGFVFLDEMPQASHDVQKAAAPLINERRMGEHYLPDGWEVIVAGNRQSDKAGANKVLSHILNRMSIIEMESDVAGWTEWAEKQELHPMALAFVKMRPGIVFDNAMPKDPAKPFATPRSFTNAIRFLQDGVTDMSLPTDEVSMGVTAGFIGEGAAAELFGFFKTANDLPTIEQVIQDPRLAKLPATDKMSAQYAAMAMCVHYAGAKPKFTDEILTYLLRLNKELQTAGMKAVLAKNKGLMLNSNVAATWMTENRALIVATLA